MARKRRILLLLIGSWAVCTPFSLGQQQLGRIIGQIRVTRGDFPPHPILVDLQLRGSTIESVYADDQGRFGFYNLEGNPYHVLIRDDAFRPVDEVTIVNPLTSPTNMVQVQLEPKETTKKDPLTSRAGDGNPYMVDLAEYSHRFPKKTIKEFDKAIEADREGKRDVAIRHYQNAMRISPDFYPAHNNLGSDYLSRSDLAGARKEFEQVIRLNQSDANAYFNLGNVFLLMGQVANAKQLLAEGMRRDPNSALGHYMLGSLNLKTGQYADAERALRQAIKLSPVMAQARLQLVNLFLQQGRKADAVGELHDFVTTFPDSSFVAKAREMLQQLDPATTKIPSVPN